MKLGVSLRQTGVAFCGAAALLSLWSCGGAGPSRPTAISPNQLLLSDPTAGASGL
jgi:hypothetical protein